MRYSDNNGATWSEPVNLTAQVKTEKEFFLGICPGRGFTTTLPNGTERIIFAVYTGVNKRIISFLSCLHSLVVMCIGNRKHIVNCPDYGKKDNDKADKVI
jgi:hypothetical protein